MRNRITSTSSGRRSSLAAASLVALIGSLILTPSVASASDARCLVLDDGLTGVVAESLDDFVCQVTFTQSQGAPWTLPSDATKLSVLGVGGGGGAFQNSSNGFAYAGGGGQLNFVDTVNLVNRDFTVTIGSGGANVSSPTLVVAGNGTNTTIVNGASTTVLTAAGGFGASKTAPANSSYQFARNGLVGSVIFKNNEYVGASGFDRRGGAGTGGASTAKEVAGLGKAISSEIQDDSGGVDFLDSVLWDEDSEVLGSGIFLKTFEFGSGGAVTSTVTDRISGSGGGSNTNSSGATMGLAGSGIVIMRFVIPAPIVTVTFDANGGSGTMATQDAAGVTALTPTGFTRPEFTFSGWNTQADGSGTAYSDGGAFPFSANTTLFAQWTAVAQAGSSPAVATPYYGPIPVTLGSACLPATGGTLTLRGERLESITAASVIGETLALADISSESIRVSFPALPPGVYSVVYLSSSGSITHQDSLRVCGTSVSVEPDPGSDFSQQAAGKFFSAQRIVGFKGNDSNPQQAQIRAITKFVMDNPGLTHVTCVGFSSGVPVITSDASLATARAQNACDLVKSLLPRATLRIVGKTGEGVGQFYRAVTLFGLGAGSN